jgi:glyoxylase-like metal-dependent hydrolase (beta-lactamase superfamily II)
LHSGPTRETLGRSAKGRSVETGAFKIAQGRKTMSRIHLAMMTVACVTAALSINSQAPAQQPLPFSTTKVEGTDGVYIYRYGGYQSMFVVTRDGVIATDPDGSRRPQAVTTYISEIRKITQAPIKYVIYSHSHFDHIAGGKPFKDLGAVFIAQTNAKTLIAERNNPDIVPPDQTVEQQKIIELGGTTVELDYLGRNHSNSSLVIRLPKEKIIYLVDFIPLQAIQFRVMYDNYLPDLEDSIKKVIAMDWERLIPGHPGLGGRQIGTKDDARAQLSYLQDLSAAVKQAYDEGKCIDQAAKEIKLPKYENWGGYNQYLAGNIERYCEYYGRGI